MKFMGTVSIREETEHEEVYSKIRVIGFLTLAKELVLTNLSHFKMD